MKTIKPLFHIDKINNETTPKKTGISIFFKALIVIFMLSWITMLPSCLPLESVSVQGTAGYNQERHHHHRQNNNDERHNRRNHHDNNGQHD